MKTSKIPKANFQRDDLVPLKSGNKISLEVLKERLRTYVTKSSLIEKYKPNKLGAFGEKTKPVHDAVIKKAILKRLLGKNILGTDSELKTRINEIADDVFKEKTFKVANLNIIAFGKVTKQISTVWLMNFQKTPKLFKYGTYVALGTLAFMGVYNQIKKTVYNDKAIPDEYERGYDIIKENLTDFGSPVKLLKTVSKVIAPYHSSIRNNIITNTAAVINSNKSLLSYKRAIGHHRK